MKFQSAKLLSDYKSEALQISRNASDIRREMFAHEHFKFSGSFPQNCQSISVPYNLKLLIAVIFDGTSLAIAQLIVYNSKKKSKNSASDCKNVRHTQESRTSSSSVSWAENPRSRKLVEQLHMLGIMGSYARVWRVT